MPADRFYLERYGNNPERPIHWEDLGNRMRVAGLMLQGGMTTFWFWLPSATPHPEGPNTSLELTADEWSRFFSISDQGYVLHDDPRDPTKAAKIAVAKARYEISGLVQQKVWARDNFSCVYCGRKMGQVQLTIDHFMPLELGGHNDETNYLAACKRCNKDKGALHPERWCALDSYYGPSYAELVEYLAANSALPK